MDVLGLREGRGDRPGRTNDPIGGGPGGPPHPRKNPRASAASPAENLPRRFGEYLLTSRLGEDCLGRVYRALSLAERGEFVRLRMLDSPELSRGAVAEAAEKRKTAAGPPSRHRVRGERMGIAGGIPTWPGTRATDGRSILSSPNAAGSARASHSSTSC